MLGLIAQIVLMDSKAVLMELAVQNIVKSSKNNQSDALNARMDLN